MERLVYGDKLFTQYEYVNESEFEELIIENADEIFGKNSVYIDIKKKIGQDNILTIPDGYLLDFSFEKDPRLYIIENELARHDPYKHIGQQLLKFAISYRASGRNIKKFLLSNILKNLNDKTKVEQGLSTADYRNIDDLLEDLIFEKSVAAIVIIDEITSDLENVLKQLAMKTDILEFKTFVCGAAQIHKFTPFQQELRNFVELKTPKIQIEELDTIVVPANEEGFNEVFLGEDCWYSIRISSSMIDRIKYIAGYQTAPTSAISYYADVAKIEKYKDTSKYILYFKEKAKRIGPITLPEKSKGLVPYSPRYTTFKKLKKAKTLSDIF
ncbi:hypothetical protein ACFLQZ_02915 [Acidobacteriota bacterium]